MHTKVLNIYIIGTGFISFGAEQILKVQTFSIIIILMPRYWIVLHSVIHYTKQKKKKLRTLHQNKEHSHIPSACMSASFRLTVHMYASAINCTVNLSITEAVHTNYWPHLHIFVLACKSQQRDSRLSFSLGTSAGNAKFNFACTVDTQKPKLFQPSSSHKSRKEEKLS